MSSPGPTKISCEQRQEETKQHALNDTGPIRVRLDLSPSNSYALSSLLARMAGAANLTLRALRSTAHSQLICPTGSFAKILSSPRAKNKSLREYPKSDLQLAHPVPVSEGRIAIVTNVGCGMRWTRERRARGCDGRAGQTVSRQSAQDERRFCGRQSRVVLAPVAGVKSRGGTKRPDRARVAFNP